MEAVKRFFRAPRAQQAYQPLPDDSNTERESAELVTNQAEKKKVSGFIYFTFLMDGCAMLWSWNMFMACATYFQGRFAESPRILGSFQSSILAIFCITNLLSVIYFSSPQRQINADYAHRITNALKINILVCTILAFSTIIWTSVPAWLYLVFTLTMVFMTGSATGLIQNGVFSFVNGFGPIYTQAIMTGQAIAGVMPAIAQIISVLAVPPSSSSDTVDASEAVKPEPAAPMSAFFYFMTATVICGITYTCSAILMRRQTPNTSRGHSSDIQPTKTVPFRVLLSDLCYHGFAIAFTFAVTMTFPVYTQAITTVRGPAERSRFFQPDVFIPWCFMLWNTGDLLGRMICAIPSLRATHPKKLAFLSIFRLGFIPLYLMCNINGEGADVDSDLFYWAVQLAFGFTNGWLGSCAMMGAPEVVEEQKREASGGFMSTCLVVGLTVGSVVSFFVL